MSNSIPSIALQNAKARNVAFNAATQAYDHYVRAAAMYGVLSDQAARYYDLWHVRYKAWDRLTTRVVKRSQQRKEGE